MMNMDVNPNIIPACSIERGITGSRFQPVPARLVDSSFQDLSTPPDPHISGACSAQNPGQQYTMKSFKLEGSKGPKPQIRQWEILRYRHQPPSLKGHKYLPVSSREHRKLKQDKKSSHGSHKLHENSRL